MSGPSTPSGSLAMVRALEAEITAWRATLPREDDHRFRARLEELLRTEHDSDLHDAIWRFKEGTLDRSGLMRDPAYGRVMSRRFADAVDALSPEQAEDLHEEIAELRAERRAEREAGAEHEERAGR